MLSTRFEKREDIQEGEKTWPQQNEKTSREVKKNMLSTRFEKREDIQEGEKTWSQQKEKTSTKVKKTWFKENENTFQKEIILPIRRILLVGTKNMLSTTFEKREDIQKG